MPHTQFSHRAADHDVPRTLRTNPRIYASEPVLALLADVAAEPHVGLCVDVDALQRTAQARVDRIMRSALSALCQLDVQVVLVARQERERADRLHDGLPRAWCVDHGEPERTLAELRTRLSGAALIGISDDPGLLGALAIGDRGLALGERHASARDNVAATSDASVRAALWWLVDVRWKAGIAAPR